MGTGPRHAICQSTRLGCPNQRSSTIDHIWAPPDVVTYKGQPDLVGSDHAPQSCEVQLSAVHLPTKLARSWKSLDHADVCELAKVELRPLLERLSGSDGDLDLDQFTEDLQYCLQGIADRVAPLTPVKLGKKTPWWHSELSSLREKLHRAQKQWKAAKSSGLPASKSIRCFALLQDAQSTYSKACRKAKTKLWRAAHKREARHDVETEQMGTKQPVKPADNTRPG